MICIIAGIIVKVVIATAWSENSCRRFIKMISSDAIISNGGAIVRAGSNIIYLAAMNPATTNKSTVEIADDNTVRNIASAAPSVSMIPFYGEDWYRFAEQLADKWTGIKALAEHIGLDQQNIAAFGDDFNDVHMLKQCGTGVAVANAIDEAKAAADYICDINDNDGVAKWIEAQLLAVDSKPAFT
jgi:hydroxymethylpyrimidine pyrophosphatase-like HAD family hydrolase